MRGGSTALAVLARNGRTMTLVEIHRQLHLCGYAIASRQPLNPGARRRIGRIRLDRAAAPAPRH